MGEEILEDTQWIRPKGTMALWEKFPDRKHKMIDEVYSQKLLHLDQELFWGYWGARIHEARKAEPTASYKLLKLLMTKFQPKDYFLITQNDLGFLQKSGFDDREIWELYGSIHHF